jgi:hypothetical protein
MDSVVLCTPRYSIAPRLLPFASICLCIRPKNALASMSRCPMQLDSALASSADGGIVNAEYLKDVVLKFIAFAG